MLANFEEVCKTLRSCVLSLKGGIDIRDLDDDYASLCGERIPFKQFGFQTLIEFVKEVDGLALHHVRNTIKVVATANGTTGHILELINGQKPSTKKLKKMKSVNSRSRFNHPAKTYSHRNFYPNNYHSKNSDNNEYNQFRKGVSKQYPRPVWNFHQNRNEKPQPDSINYNWRTSTPELPKEEHRPYPERKNPSPIPMSRSQELCKQRKETSPPAPPKKPIQNPPVKQIRRDPPKTANDPETRLNLLALTRDLSKPEYKVTKFYTEKDNSPGQLVQVFFATVEINSETFSSYPEAANDETAAKWIVAEIALRALENQKLSNGKLASPKKIGSCSDLDKSNDSSFLSQLADDNSEAFEVLTAEMNFYYGTCSNYMVVESIIPGRFYAYYEGGNWHRVKCDSFDKGSNTASVFFIDHGVRGTVDATQLCTLEDEFLSVPAQVFFIC